jgi:phytoene dehydrogenase-like protein/ferredoxin-NADP reductase
MKQDDFDVIIIGSGMGALSAASILAQMNHRRVLVIERHFEIGGFTHSFRRKGYSWDVGLHYVGKMSEGSLMRKTLDYITGGELKWEKMPEDFEKFVYPGLAFDVPSDPVSYRNRLVEAFPHERRAIHKYFKDINAASQWYRRLFMRRFLPGPLSWGIRMVNWITRKNACITTSQYLLSHIGDERLRALLTSQWGDYGLPAGQSAFAVHALIVSHYLNGGYYPHGGAERIARMVEEIVERYGGAFLINSEVTEIITRDNRVEGVRVRHTPQMTTAEYHSKTVISDIGAVATYSRLLAGSTHELVHANARELAQLDSGMSAVILFLGLNSSPERLGIRGENWWINETTESVDAREFSERLLRGSPSSVYLSFPSMKAGEDRPPTAEIIALVDPAYFEAWRGQPWRKRAPEYYALKETIAGGLLALVERHIPGFSELVAYKELATPLTIEHFSGRAYGRMYGVADVPGKFKSNALRVKTPVRGVYLTGSDVCSLGIGGALMGGVGAASRLNGPLGFFRIMGQVNARPPKKTVRHESNQTKDPGCRLTTARQPLPNKKLRAVVIEKVAVTETVCELVFELPLELRFEPGQYARVSVGNYAWRDFSIVELCGRRVTFLVDTRFNGHGSKFVKALATGDETFMRIPVGDFTIAAPEHTHVFIATGTGISPFIPMIGKLTRGENPPAIELFFGCRFQRDAALTERIKGHGDSHTIGITVCVSRETPSESMRRGRVTDVIRTCNFDPETTDFYICGNPSMIDDTMKILLEKGSRNIYREQY